ncbi:TetR family transcriptional regulator [Oenococcus oeni]|uniref:TetR/AcrR family transcriptional regulator n=1 Tax=Oenococcus oeni TaxID=1247 RepID=UPI0008F8172B|nr:TetR/AcrR family transcriptional regulator [Oenococcus oeni]OIL59516.1 TetR family transcriptional regulator [Oenococcus oeni]
MTKENSLLSLFESAIKEKVVLTKKQRAVLNASLILFSEKGYEKTSTSDIAKRAGVAEGTVYKQFKTKKNLLINGIAPILKIVFEDAINEFSENSLKDKEITLHEYLTDIVQDRSNFVEKNLPAIKVILNQMLTNPEFAKIVITKFKKSLEAYVNPILNNLRQNNQLIELPNYQIFRFIFSSVAGTVIGYHVNDKSSLGEEINATILLLEKALSKANQDN